MYENTDKSLISRWQKTAKEIKGKIDFIMGKFTFLRIGGKRTILKRQVTNWEKFPVNRTKPYYFYKGAI